MILPPHKKGDYWDGMELLIEDATIDPITGVEVFTPTNLTGCTFISRFKISPTGRVFFEFNTADNTITVPNPLNGIILFKGRALDVPAQTYIFDVEMTDASGKKTTIYDITEFCQLTILQDIT